jgi:hypothetical protein
VSGRNLGRANDLNSAAQGWKVNKDGLLLIKVKHDRRIVVINVAR